jgi:hypothetical protein
MPALSIIKPVEQKVFKKVSLRRNVNEKKSRKNKACPCDAAGSFGP